MKFSYWKIIFSMYRKMDIFMCTARSEEEFQELKLWGKTLLRRSVRDIIA